MYQALPLLSGESLGTRLTLTCKGLVSGKEGCFGSSEHMTTEGADYCMLVNEWAWSRSRVCLLGLEVDLGSVLESELGQ